MNKSAFVLSLVLSLVLPQFALSAEVCVISTAVNYSDAIVTAQCTNPAHSQVVKFSPQFQSDEKVMTGTSSAKAQVISDLLDLNYEAQGDGSYVRKVK